MKRYLSDKFNFFTSNKAYWDLILVFMCFLLSLRWFSSTYNELYFNIYGVGTILLSALFIGRRSFSHSKFGLSYFTILFSSFLILAVLVTVFSSVFYFPANNGIILHIAYLLLLCSLILHTSEEKNKLKVLLNIVVGIILLQYWIIYVINPAYYLQYGLLMNKSMLANFLVIYLFLFLHRRKMDYFTYLIIGIIVLTIITTGARTSILALLIGGLFILFHKIRKPLPMIFWGELVIVIGIVTAILYYVRPDSVKGRFVLWNSFLLGINTKTFFFGNGISYTAYKAQLYLEQYLKGASLEQQLLAGSTFSPMNEYIRILIENGVLGLCLFILSLLMLCYNFFIRKQTELLAAIIALMISCLSSYPLHSPAIWFLLIFISSYYIGKERLY